MKIIFIGNIYFSYILLKKIFSFNPKYIVGVITNRNKKKSDYFNLEKFCRRKNIPYTLTKNVNSANSFKWIKKKKPDLIFCFGWSQLIKKNILKIPSIGSIGYHPAKLPMNRGRHPIIWSLVLGLKNVYSTFFFMDDKADTGKIINQKKLKVLKRDNSWRLYNRLTNLASKQLISILTRIKHRSNSYESQSKIKIFKKKYNFWRKRNFNDGSIDWRMSGKNIENLVRALDKPFPGSFFTFKNKLYKVWQIKFKKRSDLENIEPGKVICLHKKNPEIKCGEGSVIIKKVSPNLNVKIGDYL